jgi:hypothetical protein
MSISGSHLLTCGHHVFNHYLDCRDRFYETSFWPKVFILHRYIHSTTNQVSSKNFRPMLYIIFCYILIQSYFNQNILKIRYICTFLDSNGSKKQQNGIFINLHLTLKFRPKVTHKFNCRDTNYFLSEDVISDVLALPGEKVRK